MGKALVMKPASLRSIGEKKEELEVVLEMAYYYSYTLGP
jgi:hypothetical protein